MTAILWIVAGSILLICLYGLKKEFIGAGWTKLQAKMTHGRTISKGRLEELSRRLGEDDIVGLTEEDERFLRDIEEDKAKFFAVIRELGLVTDPVADLIKGTKEGRLNWSLKSKNVLIVAFALNLSCDVVFGIERGDHTNSELGFGRNGKGPFTYSIHATDEQSRFSKTAYLNTYFEFPENDDTQGDEQIKDLFNLVKAKTPN